MSFIDQPRHESEGPHEFPEGHTHELHVREADKDEIELTVNAILVVAQSAGLDTHPLVVIGHENVDDIIPEGGAWFLGCWMIADGKTWEAHSRKLRAPNN